MVNYIHLCIVLIDNASSLYCRRMYVEEDGPSTKKLYIHVAEEHEGTYTCSGVLEGNLQSKTVHLELYSKLTFLLKGSVYTSAYETLLRACCCCCCCCCCHDEIVRQCLYEEAGAQKR